MSVAILAESGKDTVHSILLCALCRAFHLVVRVMQAKKAKKAKKHSSLPRGPRAQGPVNFRGFNIQSGSTCADEAVPSKVAIWCLGSTLQSLVKVRPRGTTTTEKHDEQHDEHSSLPPKHDEQQNMTSNIQERHDVCAYCTCPSVVRDCLFCDSGPYCVFCIGIHERYLC